MRPVRSVPFLIALHMLISLAGVLIHIKLHHPSESIYYWWASPLSVFSLLVIPVLYSRTSTVAWGFMLTAGTIIFGTIGMFYFSLMTLEGPLTLSGILFKSALPAIIILWIKLPIAVYILRAMVPQAGESKGGGAAK
ncbi:MAG: hypothetical protein C4581_03560 [Nitrospiraceae bacterium]|nr:MAG: hypothetical protein C4581_03560 [Nitrospiraceae bacterium]